MNNRDELRQQISEAIRTYCEAEHNYVFSASDPIVRLHEPTFSAEEIDAALDCLLTTRVTMGQKVKTFEVAFSASGPFGPGVMVNSGSSANLLAIAALANPEARDALQPGDEVIVPALSWSTTVWPLIQLGLVPVVVDIDPATLNIDPNEIEAAITEKTRGVMIVHVYGNPCDLEAILDICNRHSLILVEDCCEALGAKYDDKAVGSFGRMGTYSFYFSHHITTLEGGITVAQTQDDAELMRILRAHGWIREVEDQKSVDQTIPRHSPAISLCQSRLQSTPNRTSRGDGFRTTPEATQLCRSKTAKRRKTCVAVESKCATVTDTINDPAGRTLLVRLSDHSRHRRALFRRRHHDRSRRLWYRDTPDHLR